MIEIRLKLMGMMRDKTPPDGKLRLSDEATIQEVFETLDIAIADVQAVSVNHQFEHNFNRRLTADDELAILPIVTGG